MGPASGEAELPLGSTPAYPLAEDDEPLGSSHALAEDIDVDIDLDLGNAPALPKNPLEATFRPLPAESRLRPVAETSPTQAAAVEFHCMADDDDLLGDTETIDLDDEEDEFDQLSSRMEAGKQSDRGARRGSAARRMEVGGSGLYDEPEPSKLKPPSKSAALTLGPGGLALITMSIIGMLVFGQALRSTPVKVVPPRAPLRMPVIRTPVQATPLPEDDDGSMDLLPQQPLRNHTAERLAEPARSAQPTGVQTGQIAVVLRSEEVANMTIDVAELRDDGESPAHVAARNKPRQGSMEIR